MAAKPTKYPRWADVTAGATVEPAEAQKDSGFIAGGKLAAQFLNWILNLCYQWIEYFDGRLGIDRSFELAVRNFAKVTVNPGGGAIAQGAPGTLVMVLDDGVSATCTAVKSTDDGETWSAAGPVAGSSRAPVANGALVYGGGVFLVRPNLDSNVYTSPDGVTWTQHAALLSGNSLDGVSFAYGAGLFVSVSTTGVIKSSPDGVTWTTRAAPAGIAGNFRCIAFLNGQFVAIDDSKICTSPDGITWTAAAATPALPASSTRWQTVSYGGSGLYVLGGDYNALSTSPDLVTWTAIATTGTSGFCGIAYGAGGWLAAGQGGSHRIWYSADAVSWVDSDPNDLGPSYANLIYTSGKRFVAAYNAGLLRSMSLSTP